MTSRLAWIIGILILIALAGTAVAYRAFGYSAIEAEALAVAASVGASDVEVVEVEDDHLNAGFIPPGVYCQWIFCEEVEKPRLYLVGDWEHVDPEIRRVVELHELGHYRQWKNNQRMDEWDADLYAVDTLCSLGYDGLDLFSRAARLFANGRWGDGSDGKHGSWYQRLEYVKANASCRPIYQAPFAKLVEGVSKSG